MNMNMTDQPNRRARQLETDLEKIQQDLYSDKFEMMTVYNVEELKHFILVDKDIEKKPTKIVASIVCSALQITVSFWNERRGYIFRTPSRDALSVMTSDEAISPETWENYMLMHSNNGPTQEGYYWDWTNYSAAVTDLRDKWHANREKFSDPITRNALQSAIREADKILDLAPSLRDVVSLNNSWKDKWHPLPEQVPVDDYLLWDRHFLRALAIIHRLSTNPPI